MNDLWLVPTPRSSHVKFRQRGAQQRKQAEAIWLHLRNAPSGFQFGDVRKESRRWMLRWTGGE